LAANLMVQKSSGVGLRFLSVPLRKQEQIKSLIAELAEEAAAHKAEVAECAPDGAAEAGSQGPAGGMHLVETPKQGIDEQLREAEAWAQGEETGGNLWQRWRRRLGAWLSR
jgi:hypothetical protein